MHKLPRVGRANLLSKGFATRVQSINRATTRPHRRQVDFPHKPDCRRKDNLTDTELNRTRGSVTAKGAEPGRRVAPMQDDSAVARQGGRDAVFNVPAQSHSAKSERSEVTVALSKTPAMRRTGHVPSRSSGRDSATGIMVVQVSLDNPRTSIVLGGARSGTGPSAIRPRHSTPGTAVDPSRRKAVLGSRSTNKTGMLRPSGSAHSIHHGRCSTAEGRRSRCDG